MLDSSKRIRVLHLRATNFYGGPERQVHYHALAARGTPFEIVVASFSEGGRQPALLDMASHDGIPVHLFPVKSAYDPGSVGLIRKFLRTSDIDILCTHDYRSAILGSLAVMGRSSRWIAFSRGLTRENLRTRIYHILDKIVIRFAGRIVAVSSGQRDNLRRAFVRGQKISVVHNAVAPEAFEEVAAVDLRRRFSLPADAFICVSAGRFSPEKSPSHLVKAARAAIARDDRLHFILFGDGPRLNQARRLALSAGCGRRVICPGFEPNLIGCLKGADLLVNPSMSEGLPNIILEAMALKVPVVATAVGGVPELVINDHNGFLVLPGDIAALASAIVRLAADEHKQRLFAANGLELIKRAFSFESQFRKLAEIYQDVMGVPATAQEDLLDMGHGKAEP